MNGLGVVEAYLASVRLGAICVPINFRLVGDEVAYVLSDSGATAAVVDAPMAATMAKAREQVPAVRTCLVVGGEPGEAGSGAESYEQALQAASDEFPERELPGIVFQIKHDDLQQAPLRSGSIINRRSRVPRDLPADKCKTVAEGGFATHEVRRAILVCPRRIPALTNQAVTSPFIPAERAIRRFWGGEAFSVRSRWENERRRWGT